MASKGTILIDWTGKIAMGGPPGGEPLARIELRRRIQEFLMACELFTARTLTDKYASIIAYSPNIKYQELKPKTPAPTQVQQIPKKIPKETIKKLNSLRKQESPRYEQRKDKIGRVYYVDLRKNVRAKDGAKKFQKDLERINLVSNEIRKINTSLAQPLAKVTQNPKSAPIIINIVSLDVKYRNPPNPRWKWWISVKDNRNTVFPGALV